MGNKNQPIGGTLTITPSSLASDHEQLLGFTVLTRMEFGNVLPLDNWLCSLFPSHLAAITDFGLRDSKSAPKEHNRKHIQHRGVHCPQTRWGWTPIMNLKCLNAYLVVPRALQSGERWQPEKCTAVRWLYGKDWCLSLSAEHQDFLKFCWRQDVPVQISYIQPGNCTKSLPEFCGPLQWWWERQACIFL